MNEQEIRIKAMELAIASGFCSSSVDRVNKLIHLADNIYDFLVNGSKTGK